ncbi:hypothetical protein C0J52_16930 [Blattella germanica]|nr:hypothetical protein C0J52_16930 [Blattella germanica]
MPYYSHLLHHSMAENMEKEIELPIVPSVLKDATLTKYLKECADVVPPPNTTLKDVMDNSTNFPR